MFDVGFSELVLIFIVGLLVLGPEKLPVVIRTGSRYLARLRRSFNEVRAEIEREVGYDEIKRELHNQSILDSLKEARDDLGKAGRELRDLPYDISNIVKGESPTGATPERPAVADPAGPRSADQGPSEPAPTESNPSNRPTDSDPPGGDPSRQ